MWNLPPPPGFQGLRSDKPLTVYQRHLPHWRQEGATYFVTFRLADSLPQSKLDELAALRQQWLLKQGLLSETALLSGTALQSRPSATPQGATEQLAREIQNRVERWLDQGMGSCLLKEADLATFLTAALHHFDGNHYELDSYVVMPNHSHVIVRPLIPDQHALEAIVGSWKKYSSRQINQIRQQTGDLWQDESYDRILRDAEHLWRAIQYIAANPNKAGLPRESCPLWIRPHWIELGWQFEESFAPK